METSANSLDGDWDSICKLLALEDPYSSSQFLDDHIEFSIQDDASRLEMPSASVHDQDNAAMPVFNHHEHCLSDVLTPNMNIYSQEGNMSYCGDGPGQFLLFSGHILPSMDNRTMDRSNGDSLTPVCVHGSSIHQMDNGAVKCGSDDLALPDYDVQLERRCNNPEMQDESKYQTMALLLPKKRTRVPTDGHKGKRKMRAKDRQCDEESETNRGLTGHISSFDISDNEADVYPKVNNAGANSAAAKESQGAGKKRAGRGAASDPQSLYARRRRERINERLRILQALIPNGTKVDISTMLEEAVRYVKFLQLQIKLLSSDEHWMFAPLAYNGVNIGLYQKMSPVILGP
ncbi:hypothetical protein Droror1_Dr00013694 [Drosera rotundifolia]